MEKSAILNADLLDIIFEGRNKEYGAYELRRTYNRRLRFSVAVMLLLALMLSIGQLIAGMLPEKDARTAMVPTDLALEKVTPPEDEPPPVIPPPTPPPQQIQTIQYTAPVIVDEDVPEDEKPPEMTELEDSKIDVVTKEGDKFDGIVAPPEEDGSKGIIVAPKQKEEDLNTPFLKVEIESSYPGGKAAWERFLKRNLRYPQDAQDNGIQGYVVVQFVVDREGNVSQVHAISGPPELRAEAERVISKSGKWEPAIQNARKVPSYKKQPIGFALQDQ
jgi:protein TonB